MRLKVSYWVLIFYKENIDSVYKVSLSGYGGVRGRVLFYLGVERDVNWFDFVFIRAILV